MTKLFFQAGGTWRKLGYALYSDSLAYREVLNDNPQWDIANMPPVGTELRSTSFKSGSSVGLSQQSPIVSMAPSGDYLAYYPFDSRENYLKSLFRYSSGALRNVESLNGWSQNSVVSDTGIQG